MPAFCMLQHWKGPVFQVCITELATEEIKQGKENNNKTFALNEFAAR